MQFSQKSNGFRQNDSQCLIELIQLYKQNPLEKFFIFTIYQNYTLALTYALCGHTFTWSYPVRDTNDIFREMELRMHGVEDMYACGAKLFYVDAETAT